MRRSVVLAVLLLAGCPRSCRDAGTEPAVLMPTLVRPFVGPGQVREYRFVHMETTGLTSGILVPGFVPPPDRPEGFPDVSILFSEDSDRGAVLALHALDGKIFMPNSDGVQKDGGIVLVGVLDPEVRMSPSGPGMADSQPYQAFRLLGWHLRAPFPRWKSGMDDDPDWDGPGDPWYPKIEHRDRLLPEDFERPVSGDLSRFVRSR